ncbi:MAG: L,D-transpeptidase/peptidoglycan binding protein [Chloroflexota bacterium]|nr:L,D-transpeptidase/peptidoglycan binding protein [Chloroflexota bacterium]
MGRRWLLWLGAVVGALLVFIAAVLVVDAARSDVIADGVRIGSVDVGGLDREEARELLQRKLGDAVPKEVRATYKRDSFLLTPGEARAALDPDGSVDAALSFGRRDSNPFSRVLGGHDGSGTVMPRISFSRGAVAQFVARVGEAVDRSARDADIDWHDGKLYRRPARNGVATRRGELTEAILERMSSPAAERDVEVPVKLIERPDRTLTDLARRYPRVIAIDRDSKRLRLYKNLKLEHKYAIAVGQSGLETKAGRYEVQDKQVNPAWHVPNSAWAGELAGQTIPPGDPDNPLKARWIGFFDGQGIHGTDEIASLGESASHGCIRMSIKDVKELYGEVKEGTPVFVQ